MGLDILLGWAGQTAEERSNLMIEPSEGKVGFLRSTYNDTGFNRWAECHLGGRDWYWIFDYAGSKLEVLERSSTGEELTGFVPDWQASRERAKEALKLAMAIQDRLTLVPLSRPSASPETFPTMGKLIEVYRTEREELDREWARFTGNGPPPKTWHGRFSSEWAEIKAVLWCQMTVYHRDSPPTLDLQPVLVCEGRSDAHEPFIQELADTLRFIDLGEEKNGWLFWSE